MGWAAPGSVDLSAAELEWPVPVLALICLSVAEMRLALRIPARPKSLHPPDLLRHARKLGADTDSPKPQLWTMNWLTLRMRKKTGAELKAFNALWRSIQLTDLAALIGCALALILKDFPLQINLLCACA